MGRELKNFIILQTQEKVSSNQQTEYSLGKMCLISDQGCGSAVRVVRREFLAQLEMREAHNYYGSPFFWERQPSFADPRGLNNLKSGLAEQSFLSLLSVPSETGAFSLLFSKSASCVTFETPLNGKGRSVFIRAVLLKCFKILPVTEAWFQKTDFAAPGFTWDGAVGLGSFMYQEDSVMLGQWCSWSQMCKAHVFWALR